MVIKREGKDAMKKEDREVTRIGENKVTTDQHVFAVGNKIGRR